MAAKKINPTVKLDKWNDDTYFAQPEDTEQFALATDGLTLAWNGDIPNPENTNVASKTTRVYTWVANAEYLGGLLDKASLTSLLKAKDYANQIVLGDDIRIEFYEDWFTVRNFNEETKISTPIWFPVSFLTKVKNSIYMNQQFTIGLYDDSPRITRILIVRGTNISSGFAASNVRLTSYSKS